GRGGRLAAATLLVGDGDDSHPESFRRGRARPLRTFRVRTLAIYVERPACPAATGGHAPCRAGLYREGPACQRFLMKTLKTSPMSRVSGATTGKRRPRRTRSRRPPPPRCAPRAPAGGAGRAGRRPAP